MPRLSIVIPVYKTETFLSACIDSVLSQTFSDFEAILVDDGSPDRCGRICDNYAAKDDRIVVLHRKNSGVSSSRNAGIEIARGELITFMDSDDILEPYTFATYVEMIDHFHADMVKVGYFEDQDGIANKIISIPSDLCVSTTWDLHYNLEVNHYYSFVWNLCIKRSCISNIRFNERINWLEDHIFAYQCYFNCERMVISHRPCYHYMIRNQRKERLSYVHNPWVIREASQLDYQLKKALNAKHYPSMDKAADLGYLYNLHVLVLTLYNQRFLYQTRRTLSKLPLYSLRPLYRESRIYFNCHIPFWIRNIILIGLNQIKNLYER